MRRAVPVIGQCTASITRRRHGRVDDRVAKEEDIKAYALSVMDAVVRALTTASEKIEEGDWATAAIIFDDSKNALSQLSVGSEVMQKYKSE
jgi:hypothetical protein